MSQAQIKNGKKPLSAKATYVSSVTGDSEFGNPLALSPEILKELEDQHLVGRWVNAKQLYEMQGYHKNGWRPYKRKADGTLGTQEFSTGKDPEGIIRRGDCILAVKTESEVATHRGKLQAKADRYKNFKKQKAQEMREFAKEHGIKTRIDEEDEYEDDAAEQTE